jgi:hypothetical protein
MNQGAMIEDVYKKQFWPPLTNVVSWRSIPPPLRGSFNMLGSKEIKWTMRG